MPNRPNILFIHTDSQDGRILGCMGHPAMIRPDGSSVTPNIDALAERGMLFRNTYTNNPICCPSRASMLSGRYTHHCEGWNNYKGLEHGDETFLDRLERGGYQLGIFGKKDWLSYSHSIRARVSPWTRSAMIMKPNYRMHEPEIIEDDTERVHVKDWKRVDETIDWMRNESRSDSPFFAWVGITQPHPKFLTSRRWMDAVNGDAVDIPQMGSADDHPVLEYQRVSKNWMHGLDDDMVRLVRHIYFAQIAEVDHMLGTLLRALDEQGLAQNTVVMFSSDHGELALEHGQFYKFSHYEASARVPLVIAGPGIEAGRSTETMTSLIDLHPTLMDIAGVERLECADGNSLWPELSGEECTRPDRAFSEYHDSTMPTGSFMLRARIADGPAQGDWKLINMVGFEPHLFDMEADPNELTSRASDRPEVLAEMRRRLGEVVDCEAVDARVKAYYRTAFRQWRRERIAAGDYRQLMGWVFAGFDRMTADEAEPWTDEDEARIEAWLNE